MICDKRNFDLKALAQGRISSALKIEPPDSAKDISEKMTAKFDNNGNGYLLIFIKDLRKVVQYSSNSKKGPRGSQPSDDDGKIREILGKRVRALKGLLPVNVGELTCTPLMHVEHEVLCRKCIK